MSDGPPTMGEQVDWDENDRLTTDLDYLVAAFRWHLHDKVDDFLDAHDRACQNADQRVRVRRLLGEADDD